MPYGVLLTLAQLAIGAAAIFARFGLAGGGPIAVSAFRMTIAAFPVVIVCAMRGAYRRFDRVTERRLMVAGLALAAHFALWIGSLRYATVAVSTLLVCTTPIWTEFYTLVRTRSVRPRIALSIALAIAGVGIVAGSVRGAQPLGIVLALGGAIAIAAYLLLVRAGDPRYGTLAVVGRTYPIAAVALLFTTWAFGDRIPARTDTHAWAGIVAMALISQTFGHTALNAALRRLSATFVATVTLIEPAIAAGLAALIFGERVWPLTFAGAVTTLAGIAVAIREERPHA